MAKSDAPLRDGRQFGILTGHPPDLLGLLSEYYGGTGISDWVQTGLRFQVGINRPIHRLPNPPALIRQSIMVIQLEAFN